MDLIRITKVFHFEMAHILLGYDGDCKNVHGHSYKLFVTMIGKPVDDEKNPVNGMVLDFNKLKTIISQCVIDKYDHALIINDKIPSDVVNKLKEISPKVHLVPYQPTCENMLIDFAKRINEKLSDNVKLHSLKLHETDTSFAEWYEEDNI